ANVRYFYRVRATNGVGDSAYSNQASDLTAAPAAPTGLTAGAVSLSQVNLSWADNASNETGFVVERSPDGATFDRVGTGAADATSYSDTGLAANVRYFYRVRATNAVGNSAYSNQASATTAAPAAPSGLAAAAASLSQVNLSWADNASNESAYVVERSADGVS